MTTIAFQFPTRRYHASRWGTHVNEGQVEWPPSPWRILRGILATGYTKLHWSSPPEEAIALVHKLASVAPSFRLPPSVEAHSRHYMPVIAGRSQSTTKVLDTFLRFEDDSPLLVHYPVEISAAERTLLERIVSRFGYLGRAESWVEGSLLDGPQPDASWAQPAERDVPAPVAAEQVALAAPVPSESYARWREQAVNEQLAIEAAKRGKTLTKSQAAKVEAGFPVDLLDCLQWDTAQVKRFGWSQPPGTCRLVYNRTTTKSTRRVFSAARRPAPPVEAALLRLAIDREEATRLPSMTRCLPQAEAVHKALSSILAKQVGQHSEALTGRTIDRKPLAADHDHAHILPLDLDLDGAIDHLLIHSRMGLDDAAQSAVRRLRRTWAKGIPSIIVHWVGFDSIAGLRGQLKARGGTPLATLGVSTVWESVTPYIPPRWLKKKYTIVDDVRREVASRPDLPDLADIRVWNHDSHEGHSKIAKKRLLAFERRRAPGKPQAPGHQGYGLTLRFSEPVSGPVSLGYASHFGLGLFEVPDGDPTTDAA